MPGIERNYTMCTGLVKSSTQSRSVLSGVYGETVIKSAYIFVSFWLEIPDRLVRKVVDMYGALLRSEMAALKWFLCQ